MEKDVSLIDLNQLKLLYSESKEYIPNLHKTFEDLVAYHNKMIVEKVSFITKELPSLDEQIKKELRELTASIEKAKITAKSCH